MDPKILWKLSYGVYAVCSMDGSRPVGCIANSAMQITAEPASIAVSINRDNYTHGCIIKTGRFALCVLPESCPPALIGKLGFASSRDTDKFSALPYELADGLPVLKDTCGYVICLVTKKMDAGTHTVFLGKVVSGAVQSDAPPMTYAYYHTVIKGKAPKNAPTYRKEEQEENAQTGAGAPRYRCSVCGYLYEGIVPFEQLPDDFVCPICHVPKSRFVLI